MYRHSVQGFPGTFSLISSGVAYAVMNHYKKVQREQTGIDVTTLQQAVELYRMYNPGACPDARTLRDEGHLTKKARIVDAWQQAFVVTCTEDEVTVFSKGQDQTANTDDDIY